MFIKKINKFIFYLFVFLAFFAGNKTLADSQLAFTITPPLIKANVIPGQSWQTSIKIINNNRTNLILYVSVFDFKSDNNGGVSFYLGKKSGDSEKIFASQWIKINNSPIVLAPYQSKLIPFSIEVPENAEPGGHYVALVFGTKPRNQKEIKGTAINISSAIASLILLRVKGQIIEKGSIQDFYTNNYIYQKPDVEFNLTFRNSGNVHLHPVGAIKIYNMWGKERGRIPINENSYFGNVLPNSKRTWKFEWKGEDSLFEIGRYKAQVFLSFGELAKQTSSREIYFWIIPLIPTAITLGIFIILLLIIILSIRLYVKRAIKLAQEQTGVPANQLKVSAKVLEAPLKEMIVDLTNINQKEKTISLPKVSSKKKNPVQLLKKYYKAIIFLFALIFWIWASWLYFQDTLKPQKSYEILQEVKGKKSIIVPRSKTIKTKKAIKQLPQNTDKNSLSFSSVFKKTSQPSSSQEIIAIKNETGDQKLVDKISKLIEENNYKIFILPSSTSTIERSIIEYKKDYKQTAENINNILGDYAILMENNKQKFNIVIKIGKDLE